MNTDEKDRLCVAVKKQASAYIKEYYAAFGWVFAEEKDDERYEDTERLYFERPHFITFKDDLLLLQVKFEIALNKIGKLEQKKNRRATVVGLVFGLFGAAAVADGVCLAVIIRDIWAYIVCGLLAAFGAVMFGFCAVYAIKILKEDTKKCDGLIAEEKDKIELYRRSALSVRGEL